MNTVPSSSISILTPVSSIILFIVFPPEPITSFILSGFIFMFMILNIFNYMCQFCNEFISNK